MFNVPVEEMSFYSPISTTGYLTPLQRKKLREKRKLELSDCPLQNDPLPSKKTRKAKVHGSKPNKVTKVVSKKPVKRTPADSRSVASHLLVKGNNNNSSDPKERKFFKSRSPQHLKKAKFQPLSYKKTRLNFGNPVNPPNSHHQCHSEVADGGHEEVEGEEEERKPQKEVFLDGLIEFEWPSDADLRQRRLKAREELLRCKSEERKEDVDVKETAEPPKESVPKLFPIFLKAKFKTPTDTENKRASQNKGRTFVKETLNGGIQTYIDAGQKEIGAKVCPTCNMIYTIAQEQDENLHSKYHNTYLTNLKFPGWQNENVIGKFIDGRVVLVKDSDTKSKLEKVKDVLFIADRDLGFGISETRASAVFPSKPDVVFLLFISNEKRVCGCLVAEPIESACPVVLGSETDKADESSIRRLGSWYASTTPVKAICGVNLIWVAKDFRRKKVASRMLDCLRQNFLFGHVIGLTELAFTDPTLDGRQLAASYTKTDNFLVYKCTSSELGRFSY